MQNRSFKIYKKGAAFAKHGKHSGRQQGNIILMKLRARKIPMTTWKRSVRELFQETR